MADNEQLASQASSSGLFSSVFGFVHREIESFVATATGGDPPKVRKVDLIICSASQDYHVETIHPRLLIKLRRLALS